MSNQLFQRLWICLFASLATCGWVFAQDQDTSATLKTASSGLFPIGVGLNDNIAAQPEKWQLLNQQFTYVTPENCMKPASVAPSEGTYRLDQCDRFVEYAEKNKLKIVGHCLVWAKDDRTPEWFFKDGDKPASKELLLDRMRAFIRAEVGRYRGKIQMWDVVNEAIDDGDELYRPSGWTRIAGEEFIAEAFRCAHECDPDAILIYNDYNNELLKKREKMITLIRKLQADKVPVHAIGLQGHYELDQIPFDEIEATLKACRELGLKVAISELDIDMVPRGRWWADGGKYRDEMSKIDPYKDGCPPELLKRQAEQYGKLFAIFKKHSDVLLRVSFWNLHDGDSWLNYFPWNRVNHPLLFDREQKAKPAYFEVIRELSRGR
jgi:endo-1,4-beta-xylanase